MAENKELRAAIDEYVKEAEIENKVYLIDGFDNSIIGVTESGDRAKLVYDYNKMVEEFAADNKEADETEDEAITAAIEWIEYNTIRALAYLGEDSPIIMRPINEIVEQYSTMIPEENKEDK